MKKNYKYLKKRDSKILCFLKKAAQWLGFYLGIGIIFFTGTFFFIQFLNKDDYKNFQSESKFTIDAYSEKNFTDEAKHELALVEENLKNSKNSSNKISKKELYDFSDWNENCDPEMIIVNKKNPLKSDFSPNLKLCRGKQISVLMENNLENMIHDAYKDGVFLWIVSGYRNLDHQEYLYNKQVENELKKQAENGEKFSQEDAEKIAEKTVQKPLRSEHNTGLAVDFNNVDENFKNSKEYNWIHENADKYGFIERYQSEWESTTGVSEEPWHLRYVGQKNAQNIKNSQMCLEEYVYQRLNFCKKH